jgi:hypothetical protein
MILERVNARRKDTLARRDAKWRTHVATLRAEIERLRRSH